MLRTTVENAQSMTLHNYFLKIRTVPSQVIINFITDDETVTQPAVTEFHHALNFTPKTYAP